MKALREAILPLLDYAEYVYLCWARREINPMSDDLPLIVLRINQLESKGVRL